MSIEVLGECALCREGQLDCLGGLEAAGTCGSPVPTVQAAGPEHASPSEPGASVSGASPGSSS